MEAWEITGASGQAQILNVLIKIENLHTPQLLCPLDQVYTYYTWSSLKVTLFNAQLKLLCLMM